MIHSGEILVIEVTSQSYSQPNARKIVGFYPLPHSSLAISSEEIYIIIDLIVTDIVTTAK